MSASQGQAAGALTPQEVARAVFPSVVLLAMEDPSGQPSGLGSGFFITENLVATNHHVIAGAGGGTAKPIGQEANVRLVGIAAADPAHDVAILAVDGAGRPIPLSQGSLPVVGEVVYAVGNPRGLEGTFSSGIVSGVRPVGRDTVLQITAPISPGSSGGPVLDERGRVIGVATASYTAGQNLNFAMPSKYVSELLRSAGPPGPFVATKSERRGSFLERIGGSRPTAGVVGGEFTWNDVIHYDVVSQYTHGWFSLSLRNQLREPVRNVQALVVFYDRKGQPVDVTTIGADYIPAGLARRVSGYVPASVQRVTTADGSRRPFTRLEIRVLSFEVAQ